MKGEWHNCTVAKPLGSVGGRGGSTRGQVGFAHHPKTTVATTQLCLQSIAKESSTSSDRSPGFAPAPSDTSAEVPGLNEGMINPGNRYLG